MKQEAVDLFAWAKTRRDTGAAQALANSPPRFGELAYEAIVRVARRQPHVHVDDILAENIPVKPKSPNAWGGVWMRAIRDGVLQNSNQTRPCRTDPRKNAHRYPIYFSLLFDPRGQ